MNKVEFTNHIGVKLAGTVYFPASFDSTKTYAAIITIGPASGVKEQTSGLYARKLAEKGFVTIAFDPSFQGESGGEPRHQENPIARVEDVRGAVDFLVSLPYVDENRIGALGICAGGGYAVSAAMTERRINAVGVSVPVDGGRENRAAGPQATVATLEQIAQQRSAEARGAEPMIVPWIPDEYQQSTDIDLREAYQYYRTSRAHNSNWQNKLRFSTMDAVMPYSAFHLSDTLLTQPLQIVVGSKPGAFNSNRDGHDLYKQAASTKKDLMVMEGASHFDLYDNAKYQDPAVDKFSEFFHSNLK
ncbi:alpha/beta hydrolase [Agrobacterium fabrum]|uniref:alpha/beta hydrolase n=1 Tax=Agrobacterium fabrum TaxID=1176649 RepID=UPI0021588A36|nr:alpha/beta hydrolase [Agrobacterium fabrum]MCR6727714.1 alpha/beta hydrolase [Agrobacterium fabrum]